MKRTQLLCFWDYDTQWGADRSRSGGYPKTWGHLEFENTELLLELHAEYHVPACFAVVGAAALPGERPYHDQSQIRRIHAAGHEVASHSFRHDWLPGLSVDALLETLRMSKNALEQCIGSPVTTFVPPFNQPFDYPRGWSFSISERLEAGASRVDLARLCEALRETGYNFCRVAYRPLSQRLMESVCRRRLDRPSRTEVVAGVTCVRLNTPSGFAEDSQRLLEQCIARGGMAVVYGHPHSVSMNGPQNAAALKRFLEQVRDLCREGRLEVVLPRAVAHRNGLS